MKIEKQFRLNAPRDAVWAFITTPERVAACLPGCEAVEPLGDARYKALIKVQMGPIKTNFQVEVEATEERPPEFATYVTQGEEGGRASRLRATSTLTLAAAGAQQTDVTYSSDISIVGRLGKFGLGVMKKKADSMGNEFVAALRAQIEPEPDLRTPAAATAPPPAPERSAWSPTAWWATAGGTALLFLIYFASRG